MDIAKLDKNLVQESGEITQDYKIYTLPCEPIDLYGVFFDKDVGNFQRIPYKEVIKMRKPVEILSSCTAGGRVRFRTNSSILMVSVKYRYLAQGINMNRIVASGFTLMEEIDGKVHPAGKVCPKHTDENGYTGKIILRGEKVREYTLYFPLYNDYITEITLAFDKDAIVEGGKKYRFDLPVLYYGSSITQGAAASRPDNAYQAFIEKWHNVDYINLGFSGNAKGEDEMIEYLSNIKSKVFVIDYDHNASTIEHLEKTHYKVYKGYRDKNPDTPIIMMSKPDFYLGCTTKRIKVIKDTYNRAIAEGDKNVYFIDGRRFFGSKDRENCTADGCHPNDLGFYRMAKVLNKVIAPLLKD